MLPQIIILALLTADLICIAVAITLKIKQQIKLHKREQKIANMLNKMKLPDET